MAAGAANVSGVVACHQPKGPAGALRVARRLTLALVGLAAGFASVGAPGGQSSADPLAPARANAAALSRRVMQEAQLVHQRTVQYQVESARADLVRDELSSNEATARALRVRATQTASLVRQEALLSYADAVPVVGTGGQSSGDLVEVTDQTTYLALTVGDLSGTLHLLQTEQSQLAKSVATSGRELQSALLAERSAAAARLLALREAASLQVLLESAQSQVAALTAAERAPTGPPVGDGIVKALAQQLGAATDPSRRTGDATTSARAASVAVTTRSPEQAGEAATAQKTARSKGPGTRATTTAVLATTTRAPARHRLTTTKGRPATAVRKPSSTTTATKGTANPAATTTAVGASRLAAKTPPPHSTTTSSAPTTTTPSATIARPSTTTTGDPPATTTTPPTTTPTTTTPPTTTPPTTTPPAAPTATTTEAHPPPAGGVWLELRECESGDNYQADTGNGYYGAYQFSWPTWVDLGYPGRPDQEPYWMQDQAAQRLEAMDGWSQWPSCSTALGV